MLWGKFFKALIAMGWGSPWDFWAFSGASRRPLTQTPAPQLTFSISHRNCCARLWQFCWMSQGTNCLEPVCDPVKFSGCGWRHTRVRLHSSKCCARLRPLHFPSLGTGRAWLRILSGLSFFLWIFLPRQLSIWAEREVCTPRVTTAGLFPSASNFAIQERLRPFALLYHPVFFMSGSKMCFGSWASVSDWPVLWAAEKHKLAHFCSYPSMSIFRYALRGNWGQDIKFPVLVAQSGILIVCYQKHSTG